MTIPRIRLLVFALLLTVLGPLLGRAAAHPMPTSILQLDIHQRNVTVDAALPLNELQLATRWPLLGKGTLPLSYGTALRQYLVAHTHVTSPDGKKWTVQAGEPALSEAQQTATGPYQEFTVPLTLTPPAGESTRRFTLAYDAIAHQVATHNVLVSVRQDWERGLTGDAPVQLGVIRTDPVSNTIPPLLVNQGSGNAWQGFLGIFRLGLHHIATGTDHLLFLLTLLLPAPLIAVAGAAGGRSRRVGRWVWGPFGGTRRSLLNIVKIASAFTVGHSLTLLLGSLRIVNVPDAPIEALIAVSILVSAVHALRPIFPGREVLVAGFFGLIHGLAFSYTLAELDLSPLQLGLSLLGFNLGIETMQLVVIALTMPWLILLARTPLYPAVRVGGAMIAALAALGWLGQRLGWDNPLGTLADRLSPYGPWLIGALAVLALLSLLLGRRAPARPAVKV